MATIDELKEQIQKTEEQLLNLKAQYYNACFSALGLEPQTKEDFLKSIIIIEEVVEFGKQCIEKFKEENK